MKGTLIFIKYLSLASLIIIFGLPTHASGILIDSKSIDLVESNPSLKKSTLSGLIGEHKLKYISGFTGANTLIDYKIESGKWVASGSSNSGGMREPFDIELSGEDLSKLKSMTITISDDLTFTLSCNGRQFFKTPFNENGMSYFLKKAPSEYMSGLPEQLNRGTLFIEEYLYLFANDNLPEAEIGFLDIAQVSADAVVIRYSKESGQFEVNLFYSDCCDSSTYFFE